MINDNNNAELIHWFQQQQTPAGWFDLLTIMVDGMVRNVGEAESQPFLWQMGVSLADRFPLPESETVADLEAHINRHLSVFKWGMVDIRPGEEGLLLRHRALPVSRGEDQQMRWCNAFCFILEGLYSRWLQGQGGGETLIFQREKIISLSDVQFSYTASY